jgi:NADPH2:quinone reductase
MRAMAIERHGGADELKLMDLDDPQPGEHDLLVEVIAAAINPVDYKVRETGLGIERQFPLVLGYDVCGRVMSRGSRVERFGVGDVIYASPSIARNGAYAEYALVDERTAAAKPASLSVEQAAAMPLVTLTAWESLHFRARMHPGQTVLIQAGAGGVGHIGIQLAKAHGCRVITTASRDASFELCRSLGADQIINYREEDVVERTRELTDGAGVPVAFDCVGGEALEQCMDAVAINGQVVGIVFTHTDTIYKKLFRKNATLNLEFMGIPPIYGLNIESHGEILRTVTEFVDAGKVKPHIHRTIGLDDVADAHREIEDGHVNGKIVVQVK